MRLFSSPTQVPSDKGTLPAILVTTADHDDRVVPLHSYKFAAAVQSAWGSQSWQKSPIMIRIESKAGHGAGKPTEKILEEYADCYAFAAAATGATFKSTDVRGIRRRTTTRLLMVATVLGGLVLSKI